MNKTATLLILASATLLSACGGGGGGTTGGSLPPITSPTSTPPTNPTPVPTATPTPVVTPSPTPTPTIAPSITGSAKDLLSGAPLVGFTVNVGPMPSAQTCNLNQTQTVNVCGSLGSVTASATTAADGSFTVSGVAPGTYMLTVGKDSTYATLHRSYTVAAGVNVLGVVKVTALTTDEQNWLLDVNKQRATVSYPVSFGNLMVDEYAEEQARQWSVDIVSGKTIYGDAGYAPYQAGYGSSLGAMYGTTGVLEITFSASDYIVADNAWMSGEKQNCPGGDWKTCTDAANTGHYIRFSNTNTVWVGLGESLTPGNGISYKPVWAYNLMLIENVNGPTP